MLGLMGMLFSVVACPSLVAQESDAPLTDSLIPRATMLAPTEPTAPTNVQARDLPNDGGGVVQITWDLSSDDNGGNLLTGYVIYRGLSADGPFEEIGDAVQGNQHYTDNKAGIGIDYFYKVESFKAVVGPDGTPLRVTAESAVVGPVRSTAEWFNMHRIWVFIFVILISGSIIFYIQKAKKGQELYVRKIAGIDAVDEAVGRATEMGRKVYFIPGIQDMNDVQTIAGIAILGRVASLAAEYDTWLEVPVSKSLVMVTARETMKEAYSKAGRPDALRDAQVHYVTDDQFGYAAAIDGMVVREKPATIFYMGAFFAESLILAETGNAAGAIQIAGTAMPSQLPFFVAACDYTLIGEELFAASAYLSREPRQLGSLKGQDFGKAIFLAAILIGVLLETFGIYNLSYIFAVK